MRRSSESPGLKSMAAGDAFGVVRDNIGDGSSVSSYSDDGLSFEWLARGSGHGIMGNNGRSEQVLFECMYIYMSTCTHTSVCTFMSKRGCTSYIHVRVL